MTWLWPWLALAGLGAFHGINPGMGWLFAVALGLHRDSRRTVWLSLIPIGLGHTLSVAAVVAVVVGLGTVVETAWLGRAAGLVLLGWAAYQAVYGRRHRVRVGMTAGMLGLGAWSFLMSTAHGAGLMLVPVVMPLCLAGGAAGPDIQGSLWLALAALGVHSGAMLAVTGAVAATVHATAGLALLRRAWINFDAIWIAALAAAGLILLV